MQAIMFRLRADVAEGRKSLGIKAKTANRIYRTMPDYSLGKSTGRKGLSHTYYQHH